MNKKILVIGGAGYIGSHVQKQLLDEGFEVVVFDDLSSGDIVNVLDGATFIKGNILDEALLNDVMKQGFDGVVHLAAKKAVGESMIHPEVYAKNNIIGAINILNAMANNNIKYIVFSSSAAVYGMPLYTPIDEKHPIRPINYYGYTKRAIEENMEWFDKLGKIKYISLRYFNAVGYHKDGCIRGKERNPQNLMPIIMEAATEKREGFSIFGNDYDTEDGTCVRDYIHVSDLAKAHSLALKNLFQNNNSYAINLGTGVGTSVKEIVDATEKVIGKKLNYSYAERRPGDPAKLTADATKAKEILGWKPEYTDVSEIISTVWNLEI
ncbi:MAG: UDP-glucose 4-epimerase GalE [Alphaproteobacteria bacterium]|nr:UDP-glucose 4-epimerase GalE [Alphaproteobacteria bacterium]